jgi:hypothetical protein
MAYFSILNPSLVDWIGGYTAKNSNELRTGILVKINSDGTLQACTTGDKPDGFAFTNRTLVYAPTSAFAEAGESVTLVRGSNVRAVLDESFFYNATLPTFGALLYTAGNGLLTTSGSAGGYVGKVIGTTNVRQPPNTVENLIEIEARFSV